jgi:hypothetical protein
LEPNSSDSVSDFELEKEATAAKAAKAIDRGIMRSPGSFSAEAAGLIDETGISPMER